MNSSETNQIYARTARQYDRLLGMMSLGSIGWQRRRQAARLPVRPGAVVIDLGCGTGGMSLCLQDRFGDSGRVIAIDPCREMLNEAQRRGVREVLVGDLSAIPVEDQSADALICAYAIRYAEDLDAALNEIHRVLRPGAPVRFMEMTVPRNPLARAVATVFVRGIAPNVMSILCWNRDIGGLVKHFWAAISSFGGPKVLAERLDAAGFKEITVHGPYGMVMELYARA
ncbi:MAG: class I SAM-dependent methyltransferase [Phycisphaerales bacterium]|nr:class I SAM-dependent methyltransferase [Phycisphaerales bacterium]